MDLWLIILLSVIGTIIFIYLLGAAITLLFYHIFKTKLNKRRKTINLFLIQKRELIIKIKNGLVARKIKINQATLTKINSLDAKIDISQLSREQRNHLFHELTSLEVALKDLNKDHDKELFNAIKEINDGLRQNIAIYNNNVLGYNYWIKVTWYRYIFILLKKTPVEAIN